MFSLLFFKQDNSAGVTENEDLQPEILTETFKRQANLNEKKQNLCYHGRALWPCYATIFSLTTRRKKTNINLLNRKLTAFLKLNIFFAFFCLNRNEFFCYAVANFLTVEDNNRDLMYGILFRARTSSSKPQIQGGDR